MIFNCMVLFWRNMSDIADDDIADDIADDDIADDIADVIASFKLMFF